MQSPLILWLVVSAIAAAVGAAYGVAVGGTPLTGALVGLSIGGSLMATELFVIQRGPGRRLRQLPLPTYIAISTGLWFLVIAVCVTVIPRLLDTLSDPVEAPGEPGNFLTDMLFSLTVAFVINVAVRVTGLVGPRVLMNFLLGRYYRPLREERVFMFLDLADSTALAERFGDVEVQNLIREFFFDIARPIRLNGGETHRYIGDEIVVTWPLSSTSKSETNAQEASWLRCAVDIKAAVAEKAPRYHKRFGVVPKFRIGLHGGFVVASEVGEDKREIVYFGDTVNTAARLGAACKDLGADILISGSLLAMRAVPTELTAHSVGALELKGKALPLEAFSLLTAEQRQHPEKPARPESHAGQAGRTRLTP